MQYCLNDEIPPSSFPFIFAVLAASASYTAVPAALRLVAPKADLGFYIPMALGITFPFNITVGMPLYYALVNHTL